LRGWGGGASLASAIVLKTGTFCAYRSTEASLGGRTERGCSAVVSSCATRRERSITAIRHVLQSFGNAGLAQVGDQNAAAERNYLKRRFEFGFHWSKDCPPHFLDKRATGQGESGDESRVTNAPDAGWFRGAQLALANENEQRTNWKACIEERRAGFAPRDPIMKSRATWFGKTSSGAYLNRSTGAIVAGARELNSLQE
jgi:hypothetical protein